MTNRNVQSLARVAGQDFRILYPVVTERKRVI